MAEYERPRIHKERVNGDILKVVHYGRDYEREHINHRLRDPETLTAFKDLYAQAGLETFDLKTIQEFCQESARDNMVEGTTRHDRIRNTAQLLHDALNDKALMQQVSDSMQDQSFKDPKDLLEYILTTKLESQNNNPKADGSIEVTAAPTPINNATEDYVSSLSPNDLKFSAPKAQDSSKVDLTSPIQGSFRVTSPYGAREVEGASKASTFHRGIDIASGPGGEADVCAVSGGVVESIRKVKGEGDVITVCMGQDSKGRVVRVNYVDVKLTATRADENGNTRPLQPGDKVESSEVIARTATSKDGLGKYGKWTGDHVHITLTRDNAHEDPWPYLNQNPKHHKSIQLSTVAEPASDTQSAPTVAQSTRPTGSKPEWRAEGSTRGHLVAPNAPVSIAFVPVNSMPAPAQAPAPAAPTPV